MRGQSLSFKDLEKRRGPKKKKSRVWESTAYLAEYQDNKGASIGL